MIDLTPIIQAARQAATLCQIVQQRHIVHSDKDEREPVTIADYGSQAIICRAIQQHYPDDAVLSEENGEQFISLVDEAQRAYIVGLIGEILQEPISESDVVRWLDQGKGLETERMWVVDPIDGTKGFLGQRHYVNAIGVMMDRIPTIGILSAPAYPGYEGGALFYTIDGAAFVETLNGSGNKRQIHVSDRSDPKILRSLESVEKSHAGHQRMACVRDYIGMDPALVERADSQEKYGRVAAGDAEFYLRLPRLNSTRLHSIWDHAPGAAIVEAAGGVVSDVDGSPLDYSKGRSLQNHGIVVTNGHFHDRAVEAIQRLLREEHEGGATKE